MRSLSGCGQVLSLIERLCEAKQYTYLRMDGTTAIRPRQQIVQEFNREGGPFLFLLTNRVGGLGVNLIGANRGAVLLVSIGVNWIVWNSGPL